MSMRTYGDKPLSFQLEENGEYFYVGSEVSIIFGCVRLHVTGITKTNRIFCLAGRKLFAALPGLPLQEVPGYGAEDVVE